MGSSQVEEKAVEDTSLSFVQQVAKVNKVVTITHNISFSQF